MQEGRVGLDWWCEQIMICIIRGKYLAKDGWFISFGQNQFKHAFLLVFDSYPANPQHFHLIKIVFGVTLLGSIEVSFPFLG